MSETERMRQIRDGLESGDIELPAGMHFMGVEPEPALPGQIRKWDEIPAGSWVYSLTRGEFYLKVATDDEALVIATGLRGNETPAELRQIWADFRRSQPDEMFESDPPECAGVEHERR
jgi:hypothetical protein